MSTVDRALRGKVTGLLFGLVAYLDELNQLVKGGRDRLTAIPVSESSRAHRPAVRGGGGSCPWLGCSDNSTTPWLAAETGEGVCLRSRPGLRGVV
jgi:hypothetical protein